MLSASPAWKLSHWKIPAGERTYTSPSPGLGTSRFIHLSSHLMVSAWLTTMPGAGRRRAMASLDPQNESCLAGGPGAAPKVPCPEVPLPLGKQSGLSWLKAWLLTLNFTAEEFLVLQVPKPKWLQKQKYIPEMVYSLGQRWFQPKNCAQPKPNREGKIGNGWLKPEVSITAILFITIYTTLGGGHGNLKT